MCVLELCYFIGLQENIIVTAWSVLDVIYLSTIFLYLFESKMHSLYSSVWHSLNKSLEYFVLFLSHFQIIKDYLSPDWVLCTLLYSDSLGRSWALDNWKFQICILEQPLVKAYFLMFYVLQCRRDLSTSLACCVDNNHILKSAHLHYIDFGTITLSIGWPSSGFIAFFSLSYLQKDI
jgi:hypothetical protein